MAQSNPTGCDPVGAPPATQPEILARNWLSQQALRNQPRVPSHVRSHQHSRHASRRRGRAIACVRGRTRRRGVSRQSGRATMWTTPAASFADIVELPAAFRGGAEHRVRDAAIDARDATGVGRWNAEVSLSPARRRGDRDGGDSRRQARHGVYLVAGRVRAPVRVLRDGGDGVRAQSSRRGRSLDRCASSCCSIPRSAPRTSCSWGWASRLMNWRHVAIALTLLNDPAAIGIGARHITVSTVGVLPGIEALAARPEQFRLAISVHAPLDDLRRQLMPINTKYPFGRRHRGGTRLRAARHVRVRPAGRRQRHAGSRRAVGRVGGRLWRVRQSHPPAPGRRARFQPKRAARDGRVRAGSASAQRRGGGPEKPRPRHQRRVRPATGRTAGPAAASRRRPAR